MSITGEEFAKRLRSGADGLMERLGRELEAFAKEVHGSAQENFVGNDLKRLRRVRDTTPGRPTKGRRPRPVKYKTGGPIGSMYQTYKNASSKSGFMKGPRSITGNLRGSIMGEVGIIDGKPAAIITAGKVKPVKYAAAIEFGSPKNKIQPRMYLSRAFDLHIDKIPDEFREMLIAAIHGGE